MDFRIFTCKYQLEFFAQERLMKVSSFLYGHSVVLCDFCTERPSKKVVVVGKKEGAEVELQVTEEKVGFSENIESCYKEGDLFQEHSFD